MKATLLHQFSLLQYAHSTQCSTSHCTHPKPSPQNTHTHTYFIIIVVVTVITIVSGGQGQKSQARTESSVQLSRAAAICLTGGSWLNPGHHASPSPALN